MLESFGHPCKFQRVSRLGSVAARHSSSGSQPNFVALNRGRHLYSTGRPSRWASAHIQFFFKIKFNLLYSYHFIALVVECVGLRGGGSSFESSKPPWISPCVRHVAVNCASSRGHVVTPSSCCELNLEMTRRVQA